MAESTIYQLVVPAHDNIKQIVLNLEDEEQALAFGFLLDGVEGATITKRTERELMVRDVDLTAEGSVFGLVDVGSAGSAPAPAEPRMPEEAGPWGIGTTLMTLPHEEAPHNVVFEHGGLTDTSAKSRWYHDSGLGWTRNGQVGHTWVQVREFAGARGPIAIVDHVG